LPAERGLPVQNSLRTQRRDSRFATTKKLQKCSFRFIDPESQQGSREFTSRF
jgi:hypothetical protein